MEQVKRRRRRKKGARRRRKKSILRLFDMRGMMPFFWLAMIIVACVVILVKWHGRQDADREMAAMDAAIAEEAHTDDDETSPAEPVLEFTADGRPVVTGTLISKGEPILGRETLTTQNPFAGMAAKEEDVGFSVNMPSLKARNSDLVGWIYIPSCGISYPVLHTSDNDYYLDHTFRRNYSNKGAIYTECTNARDFSDYNTFIYGHNTADGTMFGSLKRLTNQGLLAKGKQYIYLQLPDGRINSYHIFSCYTTEKGSDTYVTFETTEAYDYYTALVKGKSAYQLGGDFTNRPPIITLSTCSGASGTTRRLIVHGVLVRQTYSSVASN